MLRWGYYVLGTVIVTKEQARGAVDLDLTLVLSRYNPAGTEQAPIHAYVPCTGDPVHHVALKLVQRYFSALPKAFAHVFLYATMFARLMAKVTLKLGSATVELNGNSVKTSDPLTAADAALAKAAELEARAKEYRRIARECLRAVRK